jgi:hypothetical protein
MRQTTRPRKKFAETAEHILGKAVEPASFNNFAARMDSAIEGKGNRNPVVVIDGDDSLDILTLSPKQGAAVKLDASKTTDPDGDTLSYKWWVQPEAGSYTGTVEIRP